MDLQPASRLTIEEVEALTGCLVQVSQDGSIKNMAVLDIARGTARPTYKIRCLQAFDEVSGKRGGRVPPVPGKRRGWRWQGSVHDLGNQVTW
jgi:hypothetical protein